MHLPRLSALLVIAASLSGCTVGADYVRNPSPMPDRYLGQAAVADRKAAGGQTIADPSSWWTAFGDPLLTRYVTQALDQNLDLEQSIARVAQARAGLGAAQAALLPSGDVSGQSARAYRSIDTPLGRVLNATPDFDRYGNAYELNVGASWELDLFGGLQRAREAAQAELQASQAGASATRLAVAAQTVDTYVAIRGLQTRLDVAREQAQKQAQLVDIVNLLHGKGLIADLQVSQAEGALAQVRSTIPALETALDTAMNALDVMLGTTPGTHRADLAQLQAIPSAPQIVGIGTPSDLSRRRPDLIAAERRLAASHARIGMAVAEFYPKLSLSGLLGSATTGSAGNLFSNGASQYAGVLGLRWRLFDFGRIDAQIAQAKGQEAEYLAAYRLAALRATEDVENAFSALVKHEEQAARLAQGTVSLTRARDAAEAAYRRGVTSLIDVLQADDALLRARDLHAQASTQSARAAVAAFKALGG